jgi:hypothetical protein
MNKWICSHLVLHGGWKRRSIPTWELGLYGGGLANPRRSGPNQWADPDESGRSHVPCRDPDVARCNRRDRERSSNSVQRLNDDGSHQRWGFGTALLGDFYRLDHLGHWREPTAVYMQLERSQEIRFPDLRKIRFGGHGRRFQSYSSEDSLPAGRGSCSHMS